MTMTTTAVTPAGRYASTSGGVMRTQTLEQALALVASGRDRSLTRAARALHGLPEGGWPETDQAWRELVGELPIRELRTYTAQEFLAATHDLDEWRGGAGRYRSRYPA